MDELQRLINDLVALKDETSHLRGVAAEKVHESIAETIRHYDRVKHDLSELL